MKRPKLKKASKRMTCARRFKIEKKVREHNRKLRKEAKKKGVKKQVKKDPGVPNTAPFKEEVLREAEQRRLELEQLKAKKKLEKKQRAEKRKKEAACSDGDPTAKKARREEMTDNRQKSSDSKDKSSRKFLCSELNKVIDASDIVLEVLDARDPLGCRCPQLEEAVLRHGEKKLLLVLNKIDCVPKKNAEKWLSYLQKELPTVAFKASTQMRDRTVQEKKLRRASDSVDRSRGVICYGSSCLLELLKDFADASQSPLKVGVVGFPNVGKSSVINSLKGVRACNASVLRGVTRCKQDVHIFKNIKAMDSPAILSSPSNSAVALALRSLPSTEGGETAVLDAVKALLKHCNNQQVMLQYTVPSFKNYLEFLTYFAKKRGYLQKGGVPNTQQAAEVFLGDWTGAKISYHTKAPESHTLPPYLQDTVVAEMQKGLRIDKIQQGNEETIKSVKCPNPASSIAFTSTGPTSGLLNKDEVCEVKSTESVAALEEDEPAEVNEEPKQDVDAAKGQQKEGKEAKATEGEAKVTFQSLPANVDPSSAQKDNDAYDFNVDFK